MKKVEELRAEAQAGVVVDVLASMRDHYQHALTGPWPDIKTPNYALAGLFKMAGDEIEKLRALSTPTPEAPAPEGGAEKAREIASSAAEAFQRLMVSTKFDRETRELWAGAYNDMVAIYSALAAREEAPAEWFGVTGAVDETEALAVALFAVRCPGVRMTDEDLHHYRSAAQRAMQVVSAELSGNPGQLEAPAEAGEREAIAAILKRRLANNPSQASFDLAVDDLIALRAQPPAREDAQPVGEIVLSNKFGSGVSWFNGKLPPLGAKLYTRPAPDAQPVACRFCDGAGWEDDQNWEPRYADLPQEREKGDGLIRCGHCLGDGVDPSPATHPAPDALRVAVASMNELATLLDNLAASARQDASHKDASASGAAAITGYLFAAVANEGAAQKVRAIASQAFAALQAEQKGGSPGGQEA